MRFNGWLVGLVILGLILAAPIIAFAAVVAAELALVVASVYIPFLLIRKFVWPQINYALDRRKAERQLARMKLEHPERFMSDQQVIAMLRGRIASQQALEHTISR